MRLSHAAICLLLLPTMIHGYPFINLLRRYPFLRCPAPQRHTVLIARNTTILLRYPI